jgi:hypothetical protein
LFYYKHQIVSDVLHFDMTNTCRKFELITKLSSDGKFRKVFDSNITRDADLPERFHGFPQYIETSAGGSIQPLVYLDLLYASHSTLYGVKC